MLNCVILPAFIRLLALHDSQRWPTRFGGKTLLAAATVWCIGTCAVDPLNAQGVQPRTTLKGVDLDGHLHRLGEQGDTEAVVVLFLSTQCPISNSYVPQLNGLVSQYRRRGVEFYGVVSDPAVTRDEALKPMKSMAYDSLCCLMAQVSCVAL